MTPLCGFNKIILGVNATLEKLEPIDSLITGLNWCRQYDIHPLHLEVSLWGGGRSAEKVLTTQLKKNPVFMHIYSKRTAIKYHISTRPLWGLWGRCGQINGGSCTALELQPIRRLARIGHPPSDRGKHKLLSLPDNHVCRHGGAEVPQLFSSHSSWGLTSLKQHSLECVMRTVLWIITFNLLVLSGVNAA